MVVDPHSRAGTGRAAHPAAALVAVLAATVVTALTGCGSPASGDPAARTPRATSSPFEHVHGIAQDGPAVLLATHDGLFRQVGDQPPVRVSDQPFDVMGFTVAGDRFLASGHPAPGTDYPADLGLGQSADGGRTWAPVSLLGQVDFHRLRAVGARVWGITAADGRLLASADSGRTWNTLGTPGLFDIAIDPTEPTRLAGTTSAGPVLSTDGGRTFTRLTAAPVVLLLAWTGTGLYGVTPSGTIWRSPDGRAGWTRTGTVTGTPQAIWADGTRLAVATDRAISVSTDAGRTMIDRITLTPPSQP